MKIGILTFLHTKDNYGQVLQCYALYKYLQSLGCETYLIKVKYQYYIWDYFRIFVYNILKRFFKPEDYQKQKKFEQNRQSSLQADKIHPRNFEIFIKNNINVNIVYSLYSKLPYDVLISGSDQIWASYTDVYFLNFAKYNGKRLSISSSFGHSFPSKKYANKIRKALRKYSLVSVREQDGVEFLRNIGVKSLLFLDPTFLLSKEDYYNISINPVKGNYALIYLLGNKTTLNFNEIKNYFKNKGINTIYVASQGIYDNYEKIFPSVEEWLGLFAHAEYIVTNSFHGTVFSIINQRQFVSIKLAGDFESMNNRVSNLLSQLHLENRFVSEERELSIFEKPIDYNDINSIVTTNVVQMKKLINSNIYDSI